MIVTTGLIESERCESIVPHTGGVTLFMKGGGEILVDRDLVRRMAIVNGITEIMKVYLTKSTQVVSQNTWIDLWIIKPELKKSIERWVDPTYDLCGIPPTPPVMSVQGRWLDENFGIVVNEGERVEANLEINIV